MCGHQAGRGSAARSGSACDWRVPLWEVAYDWWELVIGGQVGGSWRLLVRILKMTLPGLQAALCYWAER